MITTTSPERPAGQQPVVGLRVPPIEEVRVAFVGLGERGMKAVSRFGTIPHARIVALCDASEDRVAAGLQLLQQSGIQTVVEGYTGLEGYRQLCESSGIDLIYICTDWNSHAPIAVAAMESGKHVAIEVPAATTLSECWTLVDTAERTRRHCTMLENCCYDSCHLATLAAVRRGRLGTVVHVEGGYMHPIGDRWSPWRLKANELLRGDIYPTHGMGPACQLLGIHRTDRIERLVCIDTDPFMRSDFRNGDHTITMMRTRLGKTILLQHNVVDAHWYDRRYHVVGTLQSVESKDCTPHNLMSRRMDCRLVDCLHRGAPLDIDVYDVAEWCAVSELSRISIENGNMPVAFPDFVRQ